VEVHFRSVIKTMQKNSSTGDSVIVYTDGSVHSGVVGCGACSAILYPPMECGEIWCNSKAVGNMVSSVECEIEGILLAIEMDITFVNNQSVIEPHIIAYICCDSDSAVQAMDKFDYSIPPHTLRKIHELRLLLTATSITVKFVKIPGHVGIEGNITADQYAKDTANRLSRGEITAPTVLSVQSAFKIAGDIARKSWQRLWDNEHIG